MFKLSEENGTSADVGDHHSEKSSRKGPLGGGVVGPVKPLLDAFNHHLLVVGHHPLHLLVPVPLVQGVVSLSDVPKSGDCQGSSLHHRTDPKIFCLKVFKHKCTEYQIAKNQHAYANVAKDEGYNATEAVL